MDPGWPGFPKLRKPGVRARDSEIEMSPLSDLPQYGDTFSIVWAASKIQLTYRTFTYILPVWVLFSLKQRLRQCYV